jgi:TonB family protein
MGNRRQHSRVRLSSIVYFYLGDGTCGPIVNLGEGGIEVRAEISPDRELRKLHFSLPDSTTKIVCDGKLAWLDERQRRIGIQFTAMTDEASADIQRWLLARSATLEATGSEQEPSDKAVKSLYPRDDQHSFSNFEAFFPSETTLQLKERKRSSITQYDTNPLESSESGAHADSTKSAEIFSGGSEVVDANPPEPSRVEEPFANFSQLKIEPGATFADALPGLGFSSAVHIAASNGDGALAFAASQNGALNREADESEGRGRQLTGEASNTTRRASAARSFVPAPEAAKPRRRGLSPIMTAAAGFGVGLALCAFVIFGPFNLDKVIGNPLLHSDQVLASKVDDARSTGGAPAESQQTDTPSTDNSFVVPPASPAGSSGATQGIGNRTARTAPLVTESTDTQPARQAPNARPAQRSTLITEAPASSTGTSLPAQQMLAPVAQQAQSALEQTNSASAATPPAVADSPKNEVTGTVESVSQFVAVHAAQGAGSKAPQLSGVLQIGQMAVGPEPAYPIAAAQARIQGKVVLHAIVGTDGSVQKVEAVSGPPELVTAAMTAVHNWHYTPTMIADKPVESEHNITFVFHLAN